MKDCFLGEYVNKFVLIAKITILLEDEEFENFHNWYEEILLLGKMEEVIANQRKINEYHSEIDDETLEVWREEEYSNDLYCDGIEGICPELIQAYCLEL